MHWLETRGHIRLHRTSAPGPVSFTAQANRDARTSTSCLVLVPKKASPSGDFRAVALMSHVTKVNLTPVLAGEICSQLSSVCLSLSCRWMMMLSTCCSVFTLTCVVLPLTPSIHLECASPCHVQCVNFRVYVHGVYHEDKMSRI